jgi:hypothetical protein
LEHEKVFIFLNRLSVYISGNREKIVFGNFAKSRIPENFGKVTVFGILEKYKFLKFWEIGIV